MRFLKLFLVYSLVWPMTVGDKMVHLTAGDPLPADCSTPWVMYQDIGRTLFGAASRSDAGEPTMTSKRQSSPDLLPFKKPDTAPTAAPQATVQPSPFDGPVAPKARPKAPAMLYAPPPPLARLALDSKK